MSSNISFQPTEWKLHRHAVLFCIEQFLENPLILAELPSDCHINRAAWETCIKALLQPGVSSGSPSHREPFIFLLDDNFYYPSMRYEVYQLARKCKESTVFWRHRAWISLCFLLLHSGLFLSAKVFWISQRSHHLLKHQQIFLQPVSNKNFIYIFEECC